MHSQDDGIWCWSYHKKWSSSYDLSAYKIWTKLDQWLMRYETKKNDCCAHAHSECLVRFMTGYLDRVHGYQQKSTMTLYLLNVIFTFKIVVKCLKFGPNLHSQDDVIWYWTYYKKWSSNHNLSAYEIWTNLDQWLLRYETKKNACCAHAHCECLVRFTTGYLGRVHGYQQKPSMTLYILNVIFTFKIAVKDFKCGRGKSKFYI